MEWRSGDLGGAVVESGCATKNAMGLEEGLKMRSGEMSGRRCGERLDTEIRAGLLCTVALFYMFSASTRPFSNMLER